MNLQTRMLVSLGLSIAALGGCSASTDGPTSPDGAGDGVVVQSSEQELSLFKKVARLRVVHASPDAPAVDVYVRGLPFPILRKLAFGDTSPSLYVLKGTYTIDLRAAPSTVKDPVAYSTGPLTLEGGARITAVAAGLLASSDADSKFRVLPLNDAFKDPGPGKAAVRILHASPDAPTVGVDVGNDDPTKPEVPALARFADTGEAGIPLPAGEALQVGIDAAGARVTAFTTPDLPNERGVLVIATGLLGKLPRERAGFELLAVGSNGTIGFIKQNPFVYALHASPDAPAVDIAAGGAKLVSNLSFGNLSSPVQVPPGSYRLDFFAAGSTCDGAPAASLDVKGLTAGESYLATATGFLAPKKGEQPFQLVAAQEGFALDDAANARIRAIHASPDAPKVDIGLAAGGTITKVAIPGLAFTQSTPAEGLSLPAAPLELGVAPAGSAKAVASFDVTTTPGLRAFAVAAGALDSTRGEPFRLIVVNTTKAPWTAASILPK